MLGWINQILVGSTIEYGYYTDNQIFDISLSMLFDIFNQKIGSINKIFGRVKKTIQAKTLVDSSKRVSLTEQKFGRLNRNVLWNQPNTVNQTILLDEPFFFWVYFYGKFPCLIDDKDVINDK